MGGTKFINVYTVLDNTPQKYTVDEETIAEDIIVKCCQSLNIGPVARHLFSLRVRNGNEFLNCGNRLLETNVNDFELRLRFKLPCFKKLEHVDSFAYNYYFHQVRIDVMDNKIPDISYDKNKNELVGLGVTDMYRVMLETGVTRETVESDYKKYIPKEIRKHHSIFVKKPIHNSLSNIMKGRVRNAKYVVNVYLKQFEDMAPNYLVEQYNAKIEEIGTLRSVIIKVDPYSKDNCGLVFRCDGKTEWNHLCTIEDLCYVSVADGTTEISRKSGIPVYLRFCSISSMESFISLLDGYYRFTVKWTFNLCKDLPTPSLRRLCLLKCHGPVGGEFSYAKLEEKRNSKSGCFILRESETTYDSYYLDVCTSQSAKPTTYKIHQENDEDFVFSGDNKHYPSIPQLLKALRDPESQILLQECLPPSEYDQSPLLLCKPDEMSANLQSNSINCAATGPPQCIDTKQLQVYKGQKIESLRDMTVVYRGVWHYQKNKKVDVAIKVLKTKNRETNLPDLLELAGKWAFLESGAVVKLFGITLMSPVSIVTEYFPLGNLDIYLRENQNLIKEVDLVEAATCLANAVWHMEEAGVIHGNIRCYKLLVAAHTDNSFTVRLSDPGLPTSYKSHEIHWIPVEWHCFKNMDGARRSAVTDMWAVGTTLWEIFSYGQTPPSELPEQLSLFYRTGNRLPKPKACSPDVYNLMLSCWDSDPYRRKKPQEALRDINQNLYEVFNSRRTHSYATVNNNGISKISVQNNSGSSLMLDDLSSFRSLCKDNGTKNSNILPLWMGGGIIHRKDSCNESACLLPDYKDDSFSFDIGSADMLIFPQFEFSTATTSLDSMTSLQGIFQLDREYNVILKGRIGQGFYGEVYKGTMEHLSGEVEPQVVAVKRIKSELLAVDPATLQDFEREIWIMKKLKHRNIVEIKGIIQEPEISLVMEYIQHGPLHCYLKIHRERLNPYENLLNFAFDIAQGMEYLGSKNIVHRDLAARNILVASDSQVKISDFGLAQVTGSNDYYILKTNRELPLKWYAPESLEDGKFSVRSDVWSYGVTMYEMFSFGEDPCLPVLKDDTELNQVKLLMALQNGERLPCTKTCPQEIYVEIVAPCWLYDSHKRVSFKEISERIKTLQNSKCDL